MRIIFVRHGESQANLDRVFANRVAPGAALTPAGIAQAQALARTLEGERIAHVYTSPLERARQTAEIVAAWLGIECSVDDALREYDMGEHEGLPYGGEHAWRMERYEAVEAAWREGRFDVRHRGGESLADVRARFAPFLERLAVRHADSDTVLAVGHGGLYRVVLPLVLPDISPAFALTHGLGHGDMVVVVREDGAWRCRRWGAEEIDSAP